MQIGFSQFINTNPEQENISVLVSSSFAIGLTVHVEDCNDNNLQKSLNSLSTITVPSLNNGNPIVILDKQAKNNYFYYEIEPFSISGQLTGDSCVNTILNPFLESVGFANSDYNVVFNNVTSSRESYYIQDVDRVRGFMTASNMQNILEDTAIKAAVPDSYYTSLAHTSGRYVGSKTSINEYGVEAAINGTLFNGSLYQLSQNNLFICSQSIEERNIREYIFDSDPNVDNLRLFGSITSPDEPSLRYGSVFVKSAAPSSFSSTDTEVTFDSNLPVNVGDIIKVFNIDELMLVVDVVKPTNLSTTTITVQRNYYNEYIQSSPASWTQGGILSLVKLISDTIYGTDSAKPYRVADKKLWVEQTGETFLTDKTGKLIYKSFTCQ